MTAISIKPCPFCGDTDPAIDEIDMDVWAMCCNDCETIGPHVYDDGKPDVGQRAIEAWNKRPGPCIPDPLGEALNSGDGVYRP